MAVDSPCASTAIRQWISTAARWRLTARPRLQHSLRLGSSPPFAAASNARLHTSVAALGSVQKQLVERRRTPDQSLLVRIFDECRQHMFVLCGQAKFPRIAPEDVFL